MGIFGKERIGYASGNQVCYPLVIFGKEVGILAAAATEVVRFPDSVRWFLSANPLPKGAAYACSGFASRGGVSHCDARRLRGQSTIEYVLLIAIVALVVIVAGPGVASAIRNQFNQVSDAIGSGTVGENFYDAVDLPDPENGTAFAVYSDDDHSLMFYKRRGVPAVGDMFNYRRVTEVYTGFETAIYSFTGMTEPCDTKDTWMYNKTNVPWFEIRNEINSVAVVDSGIGPKSLAWWFYRCSKIRTADVSKLDLSATSSLFRIFLLCDSIKSIKLPLITVQCESMRDAFAYCPSLEDLEIPEANVSNVTTFYHCFSDDPKLVFDCSEWNVSPSASHENFNYRTPGVTLPKVWQ